MSSKETIPVRARPCRPSTVSLFFTSELVLCDSSLLQLPSVLPLPTTNYHLTLFQGINDTTGCALAIAYKSDVTTIQPEDFTVFSVNQTCVWSRFTDFQIPANMPPCPPEGCHCAWFWIHSPDSGSEQSESAFLLFASKASLILLSVDYMTGFKCNVTGSTSNVPVATSQVARRCGADPKNGVMNATPGNCTYGAKTPFYWFQAERNNVSPRLPNEPRTISDR